MNVLIVEDSNDKIASIVSVIKRINNVNFQIETVLDIISAQRKLSQLTYDLLIVDLFLPLREGETPHEKGGYNLVKEISRKPELLSPKYIVGLTQFDNANNKLPSIYSTLYYEPSSNLWREDLEELIQHITKVKVIQFEIATIAEFKPTLFVEGESDRSIILESIRVFDPALEYEIVVKTEKSAGATWVSNQVIAWAHSLTKNAVGNYIKSVGLFDGDQAGVDARNDINRLIDNSSASRKTFKLITLSPTYAENIQSLYQKGVNIPVTLEEMYPPKLWKLAQQRGWLERRNEPDALLKDPKKWDKFNVSLNDYLQSLGLIEEELLYLNKIKFTCKEDFCKYILALKIDEKQEMLCNFKGIISEIRKYLLE